MTTPNQVYKNPASSVDDPQVNNRYVDDRLVDLEYIVSGGTGYVPIARQISLVKYDDIEGAQVDTNLMPFQTYSTDDSLITAGLSNPGATLNFPNTTTQIDFHNTPVVNFSAVGPGVSYTAIAPTAPADALGIIVNNTTSEINLEFADTATPGIVSAAAQLFSGSKTFVDGIVSSKNIDLSPTSATVGVINVGAVRFIHSYGVFNTFVGASSGNFTLTGQYNTGIGDGVLTSLTTGQGNTAAGWNSCAAMTTGQINTGYGTRTLASTTTGNGNCAFGDETLFLNTTGHLNSAFGTGALLNNTIGGQNTAIGQLSLYQNISGNLNIALGYNAGSSIINTDNNISIGNIADILDSGVIRLGTALTHTKNFQSGIRGIVPDIADGLPVYISSTGQLCTSGSGGVYAAAAPISATDASGVIVNSTLNTITLEFADDTHPGIVSIAAQTFAGVKTLSSAPVFSSLTTAGILHNAVTTGAITSSLIVDADITTGTITDAKLATISTALKVSNSATTATSANTASAIVARDSSGDFSMSTLTTSNIIMPLSTSTVGNIIKNGARFLHNYNDDDAVFLGKNSGNFTSTGQYNCCVGSGTGSAITTGAQNSIFGTFAGVAITTGSFISAFGLGACGADCGSYCSAFGTGALSLTTGANNTGIGFQAGRDNTSSTDITAVGYAAMTAASTLSSFTTAVGSGCMGLTTAGTNCTAVGYFALRNNAGNNNTALGSQAGNNISTGTDNICIGPSAGTTLETGSNNIYIGIDATTAADANVCKIGQIRGVTTGSATGLQVLIDTNGQLGTVSSIRSKKENIIPVDSDTNHAKLMAFQPRRFDFIGCHGEYQTYGLIVDEVEEHAPELIAKNNLGVAESIYYDRIVTMLLTEQQRQNEHIAELYELIDAIKV